MRISLRGWVLLGSAAAIVASLALLMDPAFLHAQSAARRPGQLTEDQLGQLLQAMGLRPKKEIKRYDFAFKTVYNGEEWELSMSAVLSQDEQSIWVMAWLDELPRSAADVPRTALLRLLADNDRLGKGKFFAYIASNRRFVIQRVVENQNMSTAVFRDVLKDLGSSVVVTYPHWSVSNWKQQSTATDRTAGSHEGSAPSQPRTSGRPGSGAAQPSGVPRL